MVRVLVFIFIEVVDLPLHLWEGLFYHRHDSSRSPILYRLSEFLKLKWYLSILMSYALFVTLAFLLSNLASIKMHSEDIRLLSGILGVLSQASDFAVSISKILVLRLKYL